MGLPVLQHEEQWLVQSRDVTVREIPFHAYLTNRRVILQSPHDQRIRDKELALDRVEGLESLANNAGEPVLAIRAKTPSVESRRLFITFAGKPSGRLRTDERDAWHRHLFSILNPPKNRASGNPADRVPCTNEGGRVRYDPGKLVFSPGICDAGDTSSKKREVRLEIRGVPKSDQVCRFPSGLPGPSPEIHRPSPPEIRPTDRPRPPPSSPPGAPRTALPAASSVDGSFFCTTCGSRVRAGSRYCDHCGAKVIPPDPVLPVSSDDPPRFPENAYGQPNLTCDPDQHRMDEWQHHRPPGQPVNRAGGTIFRRHRAARSVAVIVIIVCIIAGVFALVLPGRFAGAAGMIIPAGNSSGAGDTTIPTMAPDTRAQGSSDAKPAATSVQSPGSSIPQEGIFLRIGYTGPWSGTFSITDGMQEIKGTGEMIFPVLTAGDSVTATIKKDDASSTTLIAEFYRNGETIATGDTTEPGGSVTITGPV